MTHPAFSTHTLSKTRDEGRERGSCFTTAETIILVFNFDFGFYVGLKFLFGFLISSALEVDKHGIVDIVYVERKKAVTGLNIDAVII